MWHPEIFSDFGGNTVKIIFKQREKDHGLLGKWCPHSATLPRGSASGEQGIFWPPWGENGLACLWLTCEVAAETL